MKTPLLRHCLFSLTAALLVSCQSFDARLTRADVERESGRSGVPLILPVDLPDGYELLDVSINSVGQDGKARARWITFRPTAADGTAQAGMIVEVCIQRAGAGTAGPCGAERKTGTLERGVERAELVVRVKPLATPGVAAAIPSGVEEFWQRVELTSDLDRVPWLR